jgi:purine-binding chemotaxis protein CheW
MSKPERLLLFSLDGFRYSLPLVSVASVISVVEITPLPGAPGVVDGVINMRGAIVPVINMRRRLRLPEKAISLSNRLVIAHTKKRTVGLMVDSVEDVVACDELIDTERIFPGLEYLEGVTKIRGDVVFIHDLAKFLSLKEEALLVRAMDGV